MKYLYLFTALLALCLGAEAQPGNQARGNYQLASRFSPDKLEKLVFSTAVDPHWLKNSDRFWYEYETSDGKKWYIVDPASKSKQVMFDNAKLASEVTMIVKDPFDAQHLPIQKLKFSEDEKSILFEIKSSIDEVKKDRKDKTDADSLQKKTFFFRYNLATQRLEELKDQEELKDKPKWASVSPNGDVVVFARQYNLYWMDKANYEKALKDEKDSTIVEHQLTKDGVEHYHYGDARGETNVEREKNKDKRKPARIAWSPDSKSFAMIRSDERKVKDLWVIHNTAKGRPELETYKYQMPGEKEAPIRELLVFDFAAKSAKKINAAAYKDQELSLWSAPDLKKNRDDVYKPDVWHGTNDKLYFTRTSRDLKKIDICQLDVKSGAVTPVIKEEFNTYVEVNRAGLVNGGKELIHWSERDGWGHFYLYDGAGNLKNRITTGPYHTEEIVGIDEKNRVLYFTANGREAGEDPYLLHLYRVNLDGSGLTLLNRGSFDNTVSMNDANTYFVNTASTVNSVPKSEVYNNKGRKVMDLETADLSRLMTTGYKFPEPFMVKADDGITDLYGVMYKPFDFDSTKTYPVIEYVYPGPQTEAVNKAFGHRMDRLDRLAQLGFIVVTVGNRGGHSARSKWYHTYGYGNLRDYGLADKKAALEQLADRHPFIDISRVGITGHSGGGFMSTAAMLVYPDFFKVAVSGAGNHENNIYNRWWSEKHHGVKEVITAKGDTTFKYAIDKNPDLAKNLKGHLLLVTGDVDNNVHPANTIRMADALIKANKRFDFMLMPGQRHGFGDMTEYFFWMMGDYFTRHLLGDYSQPVDIMQINREQPQTKEKKSAAKATSPSL
ncbi:S9 family peptidase [Pontibacter akesuensis]|uniref:Dipeptidyl aminopeptidase/acylaminoacyl peptidase n=1 Tax=Pontibacter akesuensis TaxID=388950 RepID=A0A1I7HZB3_9BACT|nr:DPP IV N-terminal domain-containing protein [Pontibacter akesuensis]GHA64375.1 X-Pro dipeptidyl-peptidase [Pontibacter akesuensis]SFU66052.1 Dipeptidyl aminopeptidase/acylaminoacyl peptidase [Pontibacter akesuensis]